eukprot:g10209.t1
MMNKNNANLETARQAEQKKKVEETVVQHYKEHKDRAQAETSSGQRIRDSFNRHNDLARLLHYARKAKVALSNASNVFRAVTWASEKLKGVLDADNVQKRLTETKDSARKFVLSLPKKARNARGMRRAEKETKYEAKKEQLAHEEEEKSTKEATLLEKCAEDLKGASEKAMVKQIMQFDYDKEKGEESQPGGGKCSPRKDAAKIMKRWQEAIWHEECDGSQICSILNGNGEWKGMPDPEEMMNELRKFWMKDGTMHWLPAMFKTLENRKNMKLGREAEQRVSRAAAREGEAAATDGEAFPLHPNRVELLSRARQGGDRYRQKHKDHKASHAFAVYEFSEVRLQPLANNGTPAVKENGRPLVTRVDFVTTRPRGVKIQDVKEVKSSISFSRLGKSSIRDVEVRRRLTKNQEKAYPLLERNGGIVLAPKRLQRCEGKKRDTQRLWEHLGGSCRCQWMCED